MKKIELFEKAITEKTESLMEWGSNPTLFWAYRNSITADNDKIDLSGAIQDKEIGGIAKTARIPDSGAYRGKRKPHRLPNQKTGGYPGTPDARKVKRRPAKRKNLAGQAVARQKTILDSIKKEPDASGSF